MRRSLVSFGGVAALLATAVSAHAAFYGNGATVVSASRERQELADDRSVVADISRTGRHVAFETRATNFFADDDPDPVATGAEGETIETDRVGGVFRRDLDTGAVELVADGDLVRQDDGVLLVRGARNPSVSGDGRYVAFVTAQRLVRADSDAAGRFTDVYVRDMAVPVCRPLPGCGPNPYTLVSARNGSNAGLTYAQPSLPDEAGSAGSDVAAVAAISDDGRSVAFRTAEISDAAGAATPGTQLLVRRLDARTTTLVTRVRSGAPDAGAPAGGVLGPYALSGDGTTVAWAGRNAERQTRFQPGEPSDESFFFYLWRRVADGPRASTRRITGMTDPEDPRCSPRQAVDPGDQTSTSPCYGPLASYEEANGSIFQTPPALSHDGYEVAFLTATAGRRGQSEGSAADLFTTSMRPGATRKQATTELTREGIGDPRASGPVSGVAMSPDGRLLAVSTSRQRFLLPALRLVGAVRSTPGVRDLLLIDRPAGTVERVLVGLGGDDPNASVDTTVSMSDDAGRIAFTSSATNLFVGDANQRTDAFVVARQTPATFEEPPPAAPDPPQAELVGELIPEPPVLSVRLLRTRRTGERIVEALPPAAGALSAVASGRLPGRDGRRRATAKVQTLARARASAPRRARVRLTLKLSRKRVALLRRLRTLQTTALVAWAPADRRQAPLQRRVTVEFRVVKTPKRRAARKRSKGRSTSPRPRRRSGGRPRASTAREVPVTARR